ncbi:MAG: hypothetical protein ABSC23_15685 [Bryobacteraceae bacterium]|jgi:hypothetical protein
MNKNLLIGFGIGLAAVLLAVAGILFMQRGAHLDMPGQILKIRTAPVSDDSSVAMIDFRVSNTSDYPAEVRTVRVFDEDKSGNRLEGRVMADPDAKRVFDAVPVLGQKYNPSLILRDRIPGRSTWDRMIGATFPIPDATLQERKRLVVSIEEIDGKVFEITER